MLRIIGKVFQAIIFMIPWIIRAFFYTLRLVATTLVSLWAGVLPSVRTIAREWSDRVVATGFPTEYDTYLYYSIAAVSFVTFLIGWVLLAFFTVWLVLRIF